MAEEQLRVARIRDYQEQEAALKIAAREVERRIRRYHLRRYLIDTGFYLAGAAVAVVLWLLWVSGHLI